MTLLVVRHADAKSRERWQHPDRERPLTKKGLVQAEGLVATLAPWSVARILSSPFVRCVQTVRPLGAAVGPDVEPCPALAEGDDSDARKLVRLLASDPAVADRGRAVVLCSHGDIIPAVLNALAVEDGLDLGLAPRCPKGCTWALDVDAYGRFDRARYLPPPND